MLVLSREAIVKIAKHAWNVYPLEAYGYLLGTSDQLKILAALPCSKTNEWRSANGRWNLIDENYHHAKEVASTFELQIIGAYYSKMMKIN